jgi:hypothetical protein
MATLTLLFVAQRPAFLIAGSFLCAAHVFFNYWHVRINKNQILIFVFVCALFMPGLINMNHGLSPVFYFFSTVAVFFTAKAVAQYPPTVLLTAFRIVYSLAILAISWALYVYWEYAEPFGEVILGSSTNGIPSYLIVLQIGLTLSTYLVRGRLPVVSPLLTGAVAFFGNGRGSLIVAGLIVIASLFFNLVLTGALRSTKRIVYVALFFSIVVALVWKGEVLLDLLVSHTKLSVGLADTNRLEILDQYIGKLTPWSLLAGADYSGTVIESEYRGNPHIAYIRTHSFYGLPMTLLALTSPLFVFFGGKIWSARLLFFIFISLAAIRAVSEPIFFPALLDFFYFLYFFLYYRYARSMGEKRALS